MKVLAITNEYPAPDRPWWGTFIEQQVVGLKANGVAVKVLYVKRHEEGPLVYYRMGPSVRAALADFPPDILHVMFGGVMADQMTRRSYGKPVVVTFHGSDLLGENLSGLARKLISHYGVICSRRAAQRAAGVIVVASHLLKALPPAFHVPTPTSQVPRKVRVIPCGIDLGLFKPMDQVACRQKLGWNEDKFHILFPANTGDPVKRPWLAQAAAVELQKQGVKAELHMLSGVPYADVPFWINASDVLILTSLHEGSPMVVKEALACGVPIVSVNVGDVAERLEGVEGCYLAAAEENDLANKLLRVQLRGQRIDASRKISQLSLDSISRQIIAFYRTLIGSSGSGADQNSVQTAKASSSA